MTRVEFFSNAESRLQAACELVARTFQQRSRIIIYAPDENTARDMDKLLWTFQATGFIPHCMDVHAISSDTPVVICGGVAEMPHFETMLNLHDDSPPLFSRFARLIEVVSSDPEDRERARARYRFYRDRGYEIHHCDLVKTQP
jgi:DNA polymerase III subunit chi